MNPPHPADPTTGLEAQRLMLSRLVDGDVDDCVAGQASAQWRSDPATRVTWHCYQLIGDVMRSEDLASTPQHDAEFLASLRTRLQQEPPVAAQVKPAGDVLALPASARVRPLPRWLAPAAMAAGFVAVAGVLVVTRFAAPAAELGAGTQMATQTARQTSPSSPLASIEVMDAALVRDAQIDRYFRAHRDMRSSPARGETG